MSNFAAFLGIDWADTKHDLCLISASTQQKEFRTLKHSPEALQDFFLDLRRRFAGQPIAVAVEQARGPLIFALLKYEFLTLYPVHPTTLARYREAFSPSRAKDDPTDAEYAAELLLHHRDRLTAWEPDDPTTRTLQLLVEQRRRLVGDRTRISNRLTALLKNYFPQALDWFPDLRTALVCDFLTQWPTLDAVQQADPATLEKFFRSHHAARQGLLERRLQAIKDSRPLVIDAAVLNASVALLKALLAQMRVTLDAINEFDREIERLCQGHADYPLFAALPGAGTVFAARLLAALGTQRTRFATAQDLACFSGVAPVIERSGQSCWTRWRYFCPKFLRQSFVEFAGESVKHSAWAKAHYSSQRAKGKAHAAAVRSLAFKWIRIIWKCWQTSTPYDEAIYLACLKKRNSPLMKLIEAQTAVAET
jgi:transposase